MQGWSHPAVGEWRPPVPHLCLLSETVPEASRAAVPDVALAVTVVTPAFLHGAGTVGTLVEASGLQGGDKTGVPWRRSLQPTWSMGSQVHEDEGGLFVGSCKGHSVCGWLPPTHMVLDFAVIQGHDEPLNEEDVIPRRSVRVREVKEDPHPCVQLLDRFVGELDDARKLGSQQLRVALRKEPALVLIQGLLGSFRSGEGDVHHRLKSRTFHVLVHELLGLFIRPTMVVRDDLELGAPGQKILPRKIGEVLHLSVVRSGGALKWPIRTFPASRLKERFWRPSQFCKAVSSARTVDSRLCIAESSARRDCTPVERACIPPAKDAIVTSVETSSLVAILYREKG